MGSNWNRILLGAAAGAFLLLGTPSVAQADRNRNCSNRISSEVNKLNRDVRRHGFFSRQAQNRRTKISRMQSRCGFVGRRGRGSIFDRHDDRRLGRRDNRWPIFRNRNRDRDRDRRDRGRGRRW
ncbi:MAG TPA: hypothetical protein VGA40_00460 [Candidatus Acidoferrales bacterium]